MNESDLSGNAVEGENVDAATVAGFGDGRRCFTFEHASGNQLNAMFQE